MSFAFGILGPVSMLLACVFELLARRMRRSPRPDEALLEKRQQFSDVCLVAAWLLLAASYLCFQGITPDAEALAAGYETWMTGMLVALLVFDVVYLYLRRARPRSAGQKKRFWEI